MHLGNQKIEFRHALNLSQLIRHQQLVDVEPVLFEGEGFNEANLFVVNGELKGTFTLICSRCLDSYTQPFKRGLTERFDLYPELKRFSEEQEVDQDIHPVYGKDLNLLPYLEEHVLLSIPFVPSCSDEAACRSKMLTKGNYWTYLEDQNRSEQIDPRLAKLARFLDDKEA
jgi:uncharacterized protein